MSRLMQLGAWLASLSPIVLDTRHRRWEAGRNAFELGRDYERGQRLQREEAK